MITMPISYFSVGPIECTVRNPSKCDLINHIPTRAERTLEVRRFPHPAKNGGSENVCFLIKKHFCATHTIVLYYIRSFSKAAILVDHRALSGAVLIAYLRPTIKKRICAAHTYMYGSVHLLCDY